MTEFGVALAKDVMVPVRDGIRLATQDPSVRGVVITGAGSDSFVSGGDLKEFSELARKDEGGRVVRREISGEYLRAQKAPTRATPGVNVETRDFRKLPGS